MRGDIRKSFSFPPFTFHEGGCTPLGLKRVMNRKGGAWGSDACRSPVRALASIRLRKGRGSKAPAPLRKVLRSIFQFRLIWYPIFKIHFRGTGRCLQPRSEVPSKSNFSGPPCLQFPQPPVDLRGQACGIRHRKELAGQIANDLLPFFRQEEALEPLKVLELIATWQFARSIDWRKIFLLW